MITFLWKFLAHIKGEFHTRWQKWKNFKFYCSSSPVPCECDEADEDDLVTDSKLVAQSSSNGALPEPEPVSTQNPELTRLALQMQRAGDALYQQYGDRVDVSWFCTWNFLLWNGKWELF